MTRLPTPTEELEIRQQCEEAWQQTWANAADLTPKQAFIEGHYLAFWCGVMACRATRLETQQRADWLEIQLNLTRTAMVVVIAWVLLR